jgi:multiple sugar transport system ATP-binding protein
MGRAIVRDPKVFLFDEPLSNLDAKLRVQMRAEIKALHHRLKTTIVYVTHDQIEAMTMADRIVVMNGGRVEQTGRPLDLYDRPANLFVAGFLGSPAMNFLPGRLTGGEAGTLTMADGSVLALGAVAASLDGRDVVVGIRPEHLAVAADGLPASVVTVDPTGAETHLAVEIGGRSVTAVLRQRIDAQPGMAIGIRVVDAAFHVFDPETQQVVRQPGR